MPRGRCRPRPTAIKTQINSGTSGWSCICCDKQFEAKPQMLKKLVTRHMEKSHDVIVTKEIWDHLSCPENRGYKTVQVKKQSNHTDAFKAMYKAINATQISKTN